MNQQFTRTTRLIGKQAQEQLFHARVALFGVGGVGSFAAEAIARSGVGRITLVDGDTVAESNLNRQLVALHSTLGRPKAEIMAQRILDIHPDARVKPMVLFYDEHTADQIDLGEFDYVIDAIDSVGSKVLLIERCLSAGTPVISCMGAGNKLDPTKFQVDDLSKTSVCPLARVMRRELKKRNIEHLPVLFSTEKPVPPQGDCEDGSNAPGSIAFVPSAAGLILAGYVIKSLAKISLDETAAKE